MRAQVGRGGGGPLSHWAKEKSGPHSASYQFCSPLGIRLYPRLEVGARRSGSCSRPGVHAGILRPSWGAWASPKCTAGTRPSGTAEVTATLAGWVGHHGTPRTEGGWEPVLENLPQRNPMKTRRRKRFRRDQHTGCSSCSPESSVPKNKTSFPAHAPGFLEEQG